MPKKINIDIELKASELYKSGKTGEEISNLLGVKLSVDIAVMDFLKKQENDALISGCAGLGDNNAVIGVNKKKGYFDLNIGNNDISPNTTGWTDIVQAISSLLLLVLPSASSHLHMKKSRDWQHILNK